MTSTKKKRKKILKQSADYFRIARSFCSSHGYSLTQKLLSPGPVFTPPRRTSFEERAKRCCYCSQTAGDAFVLDFVRRSTRVELRFEIPSPLEDPRSKRRIGWFTTRTIVGHVDTSSPMVIRGGGLASIRDQRRPVKAVCRGIRLKSERSRRLPFSSSLFGQRALPQAGSCAFSAD